MIRNPTERILEILTSDKGKEIINFVSPIYGEGPVALSIFEAIGLQLDDLELWVKDLKVQSSPQTATWALDLWETEYGIGTDQTQSYEQRRNLLLAKMMLRSPVTPWRIQQILGNVSGREVVVTENTEDYRFTVEINPGNGILDYYNLLTILDAMKPAQLCYDMFVNTPVRVKIGISTEIIPYEYFMAGGTDSLCGIVPYTTSQVEFRQHGVKINPETDFHRKDYDMSGTVPYVSNKAQLHDESIEVEATVSRMKYGHVMADDKMTGTYPDFSNEYQSGKLDLNAAAKTENYRTEYEMSGIHDTGTRPGVNTESAVNSESLAADVTTDSFTVNYPLCGDNNCGGNS
ncbi:MAG: hypothetical protein EUB_03425 [Eubacterium sp.]|uniref:putative phage tail protein n=1 Tax=Eubacterium sp. TaxID=142586 RepID=UPI003021824C